MQKILALALLAAMPAAAQTVPVTIYYAYGQPGSNRWLVDGAMHAVMERSDFLMAAKRDPNLLEVTVEGRIDRDKGENSKGFTFTLGFYRAGARLGEAQEYCRSDKATDCADQLASDITSASAINP
jgi:hypothetical protein